MVSGEASAELEEQVSDGDGGTVRQVSENAREGNNAQSKKETGGRDGGSGSQGGRKLSRGERGRYGRKRAMVGGTGRGGDHGE